MKSCIPVEYVLAVHPRACGDNHVGVRDKSPVHGPPPRVRGQWPYAPGFPRAWRSTPARAGTIVSAPPKAVLARSTPARAGTMNWCALYPPPSAVHPRACGDNGCREHACGPDFGPPPRVRGQCPTQQKGIAESRSTPARAGSMHLQHPALSQDTVHPRACGDNASNLHSSRSVDGPPPRVRGQSSRPRPSRTCRRSTPARAGTIYDNSALRVSLH